MTALTIVLADDHHVVRQGLRILLEGEADCAVVGEAADGLAAVALTARLHPAILVVDMSMPGLSGLEVTRRVRQQAPRTQVLVLSMHAEPPHVREAMRAGALGYVLKEAQADEFLAAVRAVGRGQRFLSPALAERLADAYVQQSDGAVDDPYALLTEREREVLRLAALGHTAPEIADQLHLTSRTVEGYRASFMRKLELRHQTDLVRFAIRRGIIALDA
jgi:two-component system, NarL family, response regulator NreC